MSFTLLLRYNKCEKAKLETALLYSQRNNTGNSGYQNKKQRLRLESVEVVVMRLKKGKKKRMGVWLKLGEGEHT